MSDASRRKLQYDPTQPWLIDFGQVTYEPGAPKNAPRWVWKCDCDECSQRPLLDVLHGPFKTLRAAEKDAEQVIILMASEPQGTS
jgi:hypothetical protein